MIVGRVRGPETPEEDIAALVDSVKRAPHRRGVLVELLSERDPVYAGRGTNATTRMRGYVLAAFESVGLPDPALPYVIEELESGRNAYLVAAAAKAVRGLDAPVRAIVPFLLRAIDNMRDVDDAVTFETYRPTWPRSPFCSRPSRRRMSSAMQCSKPMQRAARKKPRQNFFPCFSTQFDFPAETR